MTVLRDQVGALLRDVREAKGLTRADAARALGVQPQSTIRLEQGSVSLDRLDAVGEAYGVRFQLVAFDAATGVVVAPAQAGAPA